MDRDYINCLVALPAACAVKSREDADEETHWISSPKALQWVTLRNVIELAQDSR